MSPAPHHAPPDGPDFLRRESLRLLMFGGKGGVGKTTCATAAAIHIAAARPTARVVLISTDPAHSVRDSLDGSAGALPENLRVVEIDAGADHRVFMDANASTLAEVASRGTFLARDDIDSFLKLSLPGLDELMAFLKIATWIETDEFDCIVVDTAPTGHTLRLLEMPDMLERWLEALDALMAKHRYMTSLFARGRAPADRCESFIEHLNELVSTAHTLLTDPDRTLFVPVMLAEQLSLAETADLTAALDRLGVPFGQTLVNRLIPIDAANDDAELGAIRRRQRELLQAARSEQPHLARAWAMPLLGDEVLGPASLARFYGLCEPLDRWLSAVEPVSNIELRPASVREPLPVEAFASTRLILCAGKGGVGKTTTAAAIALALSAQPGHHVLVASTDPAHSLGDALDRPLSAIPTRVAPGLDAMEIDAAGEFDALRTQYRDELETMLEAMLGGLDMTFDREVLERLLDLSPPGLDEVMALVRVVEVLDPPTASPGVSPRAAIARPLRALTFPRLTYQSL
jgi:arsenite-transporting ATPase